MSEAETLRAEAERVAALPRFGFEARTAADAAAHAFACHGGGACPAEALGDVERECEATPDPARLALLETARDARAERQRAEAMEARQRYRIVRHYFRGGRRVISRGLTRAEAEAHCSNPETSSSTATGPGRRIARRVGAFFDGFEAE
jgi:hypothetical protein